MAENLKSRSGVITDGPDRAPSRAMLKAVGFTDEDLRRPIVGVANTWIEIGPCNYHLRRLAAKVKEGVRAAGGTPMEFNTVSISDGISMGAEGMKCSLDQPRGDRRFHRIGRARQSFRRAGLLVRLRQDQSRRGDGAGAARYSRPGALRRFHRARPSGRQGSHHSRRVRGRGRIRQQTHRCRAISSRWKTPRVQARARAAGNSPPTRCRR